MLGKFIKHEFRATGRFMWVIYAAMALLSVFANVALRLLDGGIKSSVLSALMTLVEVVWVLSLVVGMVMTLVLLVKRFHKNLLTDEGYLMFTLPGTVHHLVLSKLIVASVWLMASIIMILLSVLIAMVDNVVLRDIAEFFRYMFQSLTVREALDGTTILVELLAVIFVSMATGCLQFYSAMSIGYGFTNHKALWSVIFYFLMQFALQIIGTTLLAAFGEHVLLVAETRLSTMKIWHLAMLSSIAVELALSAVFYIITVLNLQKRLNLS